MFIRGSYESGVFFILRWSARALSVISIGVLLLFFIGEGFDPSEVSPRQWAALLLFPVIVVAGMVVAWRREGLGGGITVAALLTFYLYSFLMNGGLPRGAAFLILSAPGFLFLLYGLVRQGTHVHRTAGFHS